MASKALFVAALVFALALVAALLLWRGERRRRRGAERERDMYSDYARRLEARVSLLEGEIRIKNEVRGETDAKVNEMLTGDALGNALDVLHKRPGKVRGQDGGAGD